MASKNKIYAGAEKLVEVFPGLTLGDKTLKRWVEYLSPLDEKRFIYAIDEICKNVEEIHWGTNMIALIRKYAAEMEEDCSKLIAKAKEDPVLPLCTEDDYERQELMLQEIMAKRGIKL